MILLLLCSYYDTTKILLYIDILFLLLFFRYAMSGNFSFFWSFFREKEKTTQKNKKKAKKKFGKKGNDKENTF